MSYRDQESDGRRAAPRRVELRRPLPAEWMPAESVQEQIRHCNLDLAKVLALYREDNARTGRELKRWRDDTFLRWFDAALLSNELRRATTVPGMPVIFRHPYR